MKRSALFRQGLLWAVLLVTVSCGQDGPEEQPQPQPQPTPSQKCASFDPSVNLGEAPDLKDVVWMGVDPACKLLMVLTHDSSRGTGGNLHIHDLQGRRLATHNLSSLYRKDDQPGRVEYFSEGQKLAILIDNQANRRNNRVVLVNVSDARSEPITESESPWGWDAARDRLFIAQGMELRVLDVSSSQLLTTMQLPVPPSLGFLSYFPSLIAGSEGSINFLSKNTAEMFSLDSSLRELRRVKLNGKKSDYILAFDDAMNRGLIGYYFYEDIIRLRVEGLNGEIYEIDRCSSCYGARLDQALDFGGADQSFYVRGYSVELYQYQVDRIKESASMYLVYGLLARDRDGSFVTRSLRGLSRLHPQTFQVIQNTSLEVLPILSSTVDLDARVLYTIHQVYRGPGQLKRFHLDTLQYMN